MTDSIIGKLYLPSDNSYSVCISNPKITSRLAGTTVPYVEPTLVSIISEPFDCKVRIFTGDEPVYKMILVKDNDDYIYSVLYIEEHICNSQEDVHNMLLRRKELINSLYRY